MSPTACVYICTVVAANVRSTRANYFTKLAETLSQVYRIDAAIINQLMYGVRNVDGSYRDGFLLNIGNLFEKFR